MKTGPLYQIEPLYGICGRTVQHFKQENPMNFEKSCGAVVYADITGERRFLVEKMRHGHYALPKGHVEAGEKEHQTAEREILEETGLSVRVDTRFRETTQYSPAPGVIKTVVFFIARTDTTETCPQLTEVSAIFFLPLEEATAKLTFESDREVVRRAEKYIEQNM